MPCKCDPNKELALKSLFRALSPTRGTEDSAYLKVLLTTFIFILASAASWLIANNFVVARESGFDPFRYQYFAQTDLPEHLVGLSSYRIVLLLKFVYSFLPDFYGYIVLMMVGAGIVVLADRQQCFRVAIISPIAFFYLGQTGKDGITILAMAAIIVLAVYGFRFYAWPLFLIIALALFVRPALLLFYPPLYVLFRLGLRWSIATSLVLSIVFLFSYDLESTLAVLEEVASDGSSGKLAQLARESTFGYDLISVIARSILLLFSPLIQPVASIYKAAMSGEGFVLFEAACLTIFLVLLIKTRTLGQFLIASTPFVIVVGATSAFYHFRYIAVAYPAIWAYCLWKRQYAHVL